MSGKAVAGLSIDLDNLWCYLKEKGDPSWSTFPTFLPEVIPTMLQTFEDLNLKITFFIVGKDATVSENMEWMERIAHSGHEVANHSYLHNLASKSRERSELLEDIQKSQDAIEKVCSKRPIGFRGPGFSSSPVLLEILQQEGYLYDSSVLPTFVSPIARLYYFWKTGLKGEEKKKRSELFGSFTQGFSSIKPHNKTLSNSQTLIELPVTTIPLLKTPFHMSYLFFLYEISPSLMRLYLKTAIHSCLATKTPPNFLLHPTDFVGDDKVPEMRYFPGMQIPSPTKIEVVNEVLQTFEKYFQFVPLIELAKRYHVKKQI